MNNNPQYRRTTHAICNALMALLKLKPFEKITVQDILDTAPVTRSTFYKHFHDKYEIVEKMQQYYLDNQLEIRRLLFENPHSKELQEAFLSNQEMLDTLLKVHTEKVDIRQALADQAKEYYLFRSHSPHKEIEAQIFAHAITAFQLAKKTTPKESFKHMDDIFISAMLMAIGLPDDEETIHFIHKRKAQNKRTAQFNKSKNSTD